MNDLSGMDLIPEPKIIIAAMKACRRLNDYSLAVRFIEAIRFKCGKKTEIYDYVIQVNQFFYLFLKFKIINVKWNFIFI